MDTDEFGIARLYPTAGAEWASKWHAGGPRAVRGRHGEPGDLNRCEVRGVGPVVEIDGAGVARVSGYNPRLYFYDRGRRHRWGNVEVTVYARRVSEDAPDSHQGFIVGARSEHQDEDRDKAAGTAYYGRLMYDGRADFTKELGHPCYTVPRGVRLPDWPNGPPPGVWVGMKFVVRDTPAGTVRLELHRDLTDGAGGGTWEPLTTLVDAADWPSDPTDTDCTFWPPRTVLTGRTTSVFLRNTKAVTEYKWFTIREVEPARG
jgi:hypothetical protein